MKIEFEGAVPEIMSQIVELLNAIGLRVTPMNEPFPEAEREPEMDEPSPKKNGRPRKAAKPEPEPDPEPSYVNGEDNDTEDSDMEVPSTASSGSPGPLELHKIKEETLARLRDLFLAGKGSKIRELLKKHGHGALTFPEIEPKYFPAIKADIDLELGR
jgi:hypothetical protein